ncbi:MAG: hypothetical protein M1821_000570 [Bathelium mastoideum]|nr:MAG: hypothetical protein M1821_000570 [Bathelium mastoideum]
MDAQAFTEAFKRLVFAAQDEIPEGADEQTIHTTVRGIKTLLDSVRPPNGDHLKPRQEDGESIKHGDITTKNESAPEGVKAVASSKSRKWIVDSGATDNIVNDISWFDAFHPGVGKTSGLGSESVKIAGRGNVTLELTDKHQNTHTLELGLAWYCPTANYNMISMRRLSDHNGIRGRWGKSITLITKEGVHIAKTKTITKRGLYFLDAKPMKLKENQEREADAKTTPDNNPPASKEPWVLVKSQSVNPTEANATPEDKSLASEKPQLLGQSESVNLTEAKAAPEDKSLASEKPPLLGQSESVNTTNTDIKPEAKSLVSEKPRLLGQSESVNTTNTDTKPEAKSLVSEKPQLLGQSESVNPTKATTDNAEKEIPWGLLYRLIFHD